MPLLPWPAVRGAATTRSRPARPIPRHAGPADLLAPAPRRRPLRRWPRRLPAPRRLLPTVALCAAVGASLQLAWAGERAEQTWGETTDVVVLTRSAAPGDRIDAAVVTTRAVPRSLVPDGAVGEPALVAGRRARHAIVPGEAVVASRLASDDTTRSGLLIGPHRRGLPVPLQGVAVPLEVGDRVDLLGAGTGGPMGEVARDAEVVAVGPDLVVVAVALDEAARLAAALAAGPVVPALRGG